MFIYVVTMINERKGLIYELFVAASSPTEAMAIVRKSNRTSCHKLDWQPRDAAPLQSNVRSLNDENYQKARVPLMVYLENP